MIHRPTPATSPDQIADPQYSSRKRMIRSLHLSATSTGCNRTTFYALIGFLNLELSCYWTFLGIPLITARLLATIGHLLPCHSITLSVVTYGHREINRISQLQESRWLTDDELNTTHWLSPPHSPSHVQDEVCSACKCLSQSVYTRRSPF